MLAHCARLLIFFLLYAQSMAGCSWAEVKAPAAANTTAAGAPRLILDVEEPAGQARTFWPISAGVPFPPGALRDASQLRIDDGGKPVASQSRLLSRWPDGSVRWVLLDWQTDLAPHQKRRFAIEPGNPAAVPREVKVTDQPDRIMVDTGPLQFAVAKKAFAILRDVRLNGNPTESGPVAAFFNIDGKRIDAQPPSSVTVTESGPLRVRIELRGHYAAAFDYVVRIDAFANQPFVRVLHTFEQHSPEPYTMVRQIGIDFPMALTGKLAYSAGREAAAPLSGTLAAQGFTLAQEDNEGLRTAGGARQPGRAAGWVDLSDSNHGLALAARFFWQEYPQSFQLRSTGLTYNLWAPEAPPAKVGMGAAKTHEMIVYFHGKSPPAAAMLGALNQPVLARVDPRWTVASGALRNSIAPGTATKPFLDELGKAYRHYLAHAETERWDDSGQAHCPDAAQERPRRGFFGMFNWGDWNYPGYHDTTKGCDAWGNLEYDMTQVLALAYAATREPAYYTGMLAAARHFMDVDTIHFQRQHPTWVGMNHPKNPLHFSFELGGVDLGHTWTEGLLSYYYLTGDERGLEAARGIADYLVQRLRSPVVIGNPRQFGWPQIALVAAYEATGNASYKSAALEYARKGMAAHLPDKVGDWKLGILAEALTYTHAVTQDPAIQQWLTRYAGTVSARGAAVDARFLPAIAYVARMSPKDDYQRAAAATVPRLKLGTWGKPFTIAGRLGFSILSATTSAGDSKTVSH